MSGSDGCGGLVWNSAGRKNAVSTSFLNVFPSSVKFTLLITGTVIPRKRPAQTWQITWPTCNSCARISAGSNKSEHQHGSSETRCVWAESDPQSSLCRWSAWVSWSPWKCSARTGLLLESHRPSSLLGRPAPRTAPPPSARVTNGNATIREFSSVWTRLLKVAY